MEPRYFHIAKPCNQSWDAMSLEKNGRHCGKCDKTIIDFSALSDEALLKFFNHNPAVHCGRFHHEQLDRLLTAPTPQHHFFRRFKPRMLKAVAFIAGILLFRQPNMARRLPVSIVENFPKNYFKDPINSSEPIIISGSVTDEYNKPLGKVKVVLELNEELFTETDEKGMFSFSVLSDSLSRHTYPKIYFHYDGYVTTVRSYHMAMGSTAFNVQMLPPPQGHMIMGAMSEPVVLDLKEMFFKPGIAGLDRKSKKILDTLGTQLKNNPGISILIESYPPVCGKQSIGEKRVDIVKAYLVDKAGIGADRITTNCEVDGGNVNMVVIKQN